MGMAEAKYHRIEGYVDDPWNISTFIPKKEEI